MNIMELVEEILDTLRYMDDAVNVICNLDAKAVVERMEVADVISIPEGATNGDMLLNMFDTATIYVIDEENDYITICIDSYYYQKFIYSWWKAPYKGVEE